MEKKPQPKNREYAALLSPMTVIRKNHLSKKDVNRIKRHLSAKTAFTSLIVAFVTFALGLGIFLYESISTNWSQTAVYGINAVIGQVIIIVGSLITILLYFAAKPHLHDHYGRVLTRMCNDVLLVSISLLVIFSIFADAQAGFTSEGRAVSAAMLIICLMLLIQPAYWVDAIVIDVLFSAGVITVAIICANIFGMNEITYYIIVAALYPGVCYLVDIRSFYAETQHYCQTLISERLYDSSNYDELTHCKNRTALSRYLSENEQEEATNHLYLMLLFDVDNFKEYND
ncbi:MAG: diguanylate cyclase [Bacilli bacterium]|nr:diguanylate cyclase [Bacilli bacterium]